ncbi:MAG: MarR family winged helix-turn-helix transcriptional regulator [Bacilli bacterium]|nr:MarR family winged helix-turn-helix transcriptional regulator [Bacilli bacterium]
MGKQDCRRDIIYLIRHLSKLLQNDFDNRINQYGITGQQARILFFVNHKTVLDNVEVHQNDIENEFNLAKSTVNGLISRLEKKNFIIKQNKHPFSVITVSDKGKELIADLREGRDNTIEKLFEGFNKEEREKILENVSKLLTNFEGGNEDVAKN